MMEVVSGDSWSYKTCKTPVKLLPLTNQHPVFYRPDALPVARPTVQVKVVVLYSASTLSVSKVLRYSTHCQGISQFYLHTLVSSD